MPRSNEANQRLRQATRERVLSAAVRLFARRGFHGTSVRAIADEADIALGSMYAHFASKEAVLQALMAASVLDVEATLTEAEQATTARDFVTRLLRAAIATVREHRDAWAVAYALQHQPEVVKTLAAPVQQFARATVQRLTTALKQRSAPASLENALVLFALVDGISQQYVRLGKGYPVEAVIAAAAAPYPTAPMKRGRR